MKRKLACLFDWQWPDAVISLFFSPNQRADQNSSFVIDLLSPYTDVNPPAAYIKLSVCNKSLKEVCVLDGKPLCVQLILLPALKT